MDSREIVLFIKIETNKPVLLVFDLFMTHIVHFSFSKKRVSESFFPQKSPVFFTVVPMTVLMSYVPGLDKCGQSSL
jgi:hypothetical protein